MSIRRPEFVQQHLRVSQIGRVETLAREVVGFGVTALVAAQPCKAPSGAQFPDDRFSMSRQKGISPLEMAVGHAAKHELDPRGDAASRRDRNGRTT
jgi:hypothetical protein